MWQSHHRPPLPPIVSVDHHIPRQVLRAPAALLLLPLTLPLLLAAGPRGHRGARVWRAAGASAAAVVRPEDSGGQDNIETFEELPVVSVDVGYLGEEYGPGSWATSLASLETISTRSPPLYG